MASLKRRHRYLNIYGARLSKPALPSNDADHRKPSETDEFGRRSLRRWKDVRSTVTQRGIGGPTIDKARRAKTSEGKDPEGDTVKHIEPSGYYYPNLIARIYLEAMEEVMGRNGLNAVLNLAGLSHLIGNYPPRNLQKEFDFADYSALNGALDELYGPRGGRGLQLRAGRASFARGLQGLGALSGVGDLAFKILPLSAKLKAGIPAMAKVFTQVSDQKSTVENRGDFYAYVMDPCPVCWGRHDDRPICFAGKGLLEEGLHWVSGGRKFRVNEIECVAMGDSTCTYAIHKEPIG